MRNHWYDILVAALAGLGVWALLWALFKATSLR